MPRYEYSPERDVRASPKEAGEVFAVLKKWVMRHAPIFVSGAALRKEDSLWVATGPVFQEASLSGPRTAQMVPRAAPILGVGSGSLSVVYEVPYLKEQEDPEYEGDVVLRSATTKLIVDDPIIPNVSSRSYVFEAGPGSSDASGSVGDTPRPPGPWPDIGRTPCAVLVEVMAAWEEVAVATGKQVRYTWH